MIDIREYHKLLRDYKLKETNGHLLMPGEPNKNTIHKVVKKLFSALDDPRAENPNFRLYKLKGFCGYAECVSPQCFFFRLNPSILNTTLDKEDIIDIAQDMDLERIQLIGAKKYLEEYNSTQPDILKLSPADFKLILTYMMKGNGDAS